MAQEQADNILKTASDMVPETEIKQPDPLAPKVPFPTVYKLSLEQESQLIDHAMERLGQLESELGRNLITTHDEWWANADETIRQGCHRSFMGKRQLFEMIYHNRMEWRKTLLGGIFEKSNLVVPLARRICRQMVARACNYFFGTDPWFAAIPVGPTDDATAKIGEKFAAHKFEQGVVKGSLERTVENGFVLGECVVKRTHATEEDYYQENANVLVDESGQPVLGADGDYITDQDVWVPMMAMEDPMAADTATAATPPEQAPAEMTQTASTGAQAPMQPGRKPQLPMVEIQAQPVGEVLKRDGVTPRPENPLFEYQVITRRLIHYRGPRAEAVYFKDFLCPLAAENLQVADCIVHLYDMPVAVLADHYSKSGIIDPNKPRVEGVQRAIELIRRLAGEDSRPKSASTQERAELGEGGTGDQQTFTDTGGPVVEVAEFWLYFDANNDGIRENILLVVDRKEQLPIFYDYVANVTPDGKRPFSVVSPNKVNGRWHGIGAIEMFETYQNVADLLVNRQNVEQGAMGRVDFWRPENTVEGKNNPNLELNRGKTYRPLPNKRMEDCLETAYLESTRTEKLQDLVEFFLQLAMNESGTSHANDNYVAGMDSAKLATGIRNVEKTGQELFGLPISHLTPGLRETVQGLVYLVFANLEEEEVFTYFEDRIPIQISVKPEMVRNLDLDIQILLTRFREEQVVQSGTQAVQLVVGATPFIGLPAPLMPVLAPLFVSMLKALQVPDSDKIIDAVSQLGPQLALMQQAAAAAGAPGETPAKPPGQAPSNL